MRPGSTLSGLYIFIEPVPSRRRASMGIREEDLPGTLFAQPVVAQVVECGLEVVEDDGVTEAFEDE